MSRKSNSPTIQTYTEFQQAYDFFNRELFSAELPACLITLHRESDRILGYFSSQRFVQLADGRTATDEIAMNPTHFQRRSIEQSLSTLVHEMVHLWQAHFGKPGRRGYHNKEWADKMISVGLHPSHNGQEGGKTTGEKMTHYIVADGVFATKVVELLSDGFQITWGDAALRPEDTTTPAKKNKSNRVKFICGGCGCAAWGKPSLNLVCGDCDMALECIDPDTPDDD